MANSAKPTSLLLYTINYSHKTFIIQASGFGKLSNRKMVHALDTDIRLWQKWLKLAKPLVYYSTLLITAIKTFIVQATYLQNGSKLEHKC